MANFATNIPFDEVKRQEQAEKIASPLRDLTAEFMHSADKLGININHLKIRWVYDDGKHIIEGGIG